MAKQNPFEHVFFYTPVEIRGHVAFYVENYLACELDEVGIYPPAECYLRAIGGKILDLDLSNAEWDAVTNAANAHRVRAPQLPAFN